MGDHHKSDDSSAILPSVRSLRHLAVSESGFVFDPVRGHHFSVNETGLEILRHLQQEMDLPELLKLLSEEYDVSGRELERDVLEFTGMLRKFIEG